MCCRNWSWPHPVQGEWQTPITHEEVDVIMAYHMIQEAAAGYFPISVVTDDTDLLLVLAHYLHTHVNNLPHSIQVTMEGYSGSHAIIDVIEGYCSTTAYPLKCCTISIS